MFDEHRDRLAISRAALSDGSRMLTSRAMMATTTSTSMSVKARPADRRTPFLFDT
jgi:hypothetical protein